MIQATRTLCLAFVIVLMVGCASPVLHRRSADGSEEVLYLSPFIALWKNPSGEGSQEWLYTLSQTYWLNDPELASSTGDISSKDLVNSVVLIGRSESKGLLVGKGRDRDPQTWLDNDRFFILTYDRLIFFRTEQAMRNCLKENWQISTLRLTRIEEFYEQEKKGRQQAGCSELSTDAAVSYPEPVVRGAEPNG